VFSGMLGVTLFGIFLTPVFFFVIQWFGKQKPGAATPAVAGEPAAAAPPSPPAPGNGQLVVVPQPQGGEKRSQQ